MTDEIVTSDTPSASSQLNSSSRVICRVCQKQFSQYTCPRCNIRYCSLPCYKSHSLRCTESFMRENVMGELQNLQPGDESRQKMMDILKRFHDEEEMEGTDEEDISLSEETIQKVLSGDHISLDDLSAEEKKRFQRAVASGELSKLIKPWEPWWLRPSAKSISLGLNGIQLVQPLANQETRASSEDDLEIDQLNEIPSGPEAPLPSVSKLTATEPSPLLAVHLVDIIYSYCFTLRLYNGDWESDPVGSAMDLLSISSVLGQGGQPETVFEALFNCLEQTCTPSFRHMGGLQFGLGLLDDVSNLLLLGGPALVCLLSDVRRLIQAAETGLKMEKSRKSKRVEIKTRLKSAERKVYFLMCWVHEQPAEVWPSLAAIVKTEKDQARECGGKGQLKKGEKTEVPGKPLIKEIQ